MALLLQSFDTHHLFALDEFFGQDRQRYYNKIQQARDLDDDLSYWLEYVAAGEPLSPSYEGDRGEDQLKRLQDC